ncbi:3-dehydroquinate synthase [Bacillus horti]|uniref:3-dehydroquinate synthase n=1 Tax=Caldalkalibacillus horti TaxID=77523 RepID=A0ABT9VWV0_9BACI|nr:3-dehydroquinate synthase [Bacillus horti]MDQ0165473.1 3-dehydroquinate synthase [Bacillus horti]
MEALQTIQVKLGERSYPIWIGPHLLQELPSYLEKLKVTTKQKLLIVTDSHVEPWYLTGLKEGLEQAGYFVCSYTIPAGEESKSLQQYEQVLTYALEQKLDRRSIVLALGGGVVGDLAGFVASTFMRGVGFIQLPTTVLAHDSSVGGKVAVNHPLGKNLIGSFYQPLAVIYDTMTLKSLPKREVASGLAEVIKLGLIKDRSFLEWLAEHKVQLLGLEEPFLSHALGVACQIKADIVSKDEREEGIRALLNLGHTFGHALESLGGYGKYTHGEAVSIGMVMAAQTSEYVYGRDDLKQQVQEILSSYGLPVAYNTDWSEKQILDKMYLDKKVLAGALNLVLLEDIGNGKVVPDVAPELIINAIKAHK